MTQGALADASGISVATIARIERGEVTARALTRAKLNDVLQGAPGSVLDATPQIPPPGMPSIAQLPRPVQVRIVAFAYRSISDVDPAAAALAVSTYVGPSSPLGARGARLFREVLEATYGVDPVLATEFGIAVAEAIGGNGDPDLERLWAEIWLRATDRDRPMLAVVLDEFENRYVVDGDD